MSSTQGTLSVKLKDALQLPVPKQHSLLGRKLSPYVVLTLGSDRQQSRTSVSGHRNPVWLQDFTFKLGPGTSELKLEVFHDATFSKDTLLCTGSVPAPQLTVPGVNAKRVFVECAGDNHGSGELHLDISFTPAVEAQAGRQMSTALSGMSHQHTSGSLESAPSRSSVTTGAYTAQPHRGSFEGRVDDTPSWLTGNAVSRTQDINSKSSSPYADHLENGRQSSLQPGEKLSTSPSRSFRKKIGKKFGKVLGSKHREGRAEATNPVVEDGNHLNQQASAALSAQSLEEIPELPAQQHAAINSGQLLSSNQSNSVTSDTDSQTDWEPNHTEYNSQRNNNTARPLHEQSYAPSWQQNQDTRRAQSGMALEPVEESDVPTRSGSQWLRQWEGNPRRATESALPDHYQAEALTAAQPDPRRQTETFERISGPMFEQPIRVDPNKGYFRGGREVREWAEQEGPVHSNFHFEPFNSRSDVIPFMNQRDPDGAWDMSAKHQRLMSSQKEVMRQPWGQGAAAPDPLSAASTSLNLMDGDYFAPPVQDSEIDPKDISGSLSALELGRNRQPGNEGLEMQQPMRVPREPRQEAGDPELIVEPRRLSGSAPVSWRQLPAGLERPSTAGSGRFSQEAASTASYPQPDYEGRGSITDRMAGFEHGQRPSIFAEAYARSRQQDHNIGEYDWDANFGRNRAPEFAGEDSAFITTGHDQHQAEAGRQGDGAADPDVSSFVGYMSPFAADEEPLAEDGSVPSSSGTSAQNPSVGAGSAENSRGQPGKKSHRRLGSEGRVPMRDVQARIESATMSEVREEDGRAPETQFSDYEALKLLVAEETWLIDEGDLEIDINERGDMVKLGSGSFGTVYRGVFDHSTEVAIKCLPVQTKKLMDDALHEVAVLKQLQHPHVVQFLGASVGKQSIQLVTELMAGNLYKALQNGHCTWHKGGKLIAKNIASALAFLYKKKIVHMDIKSANILLSSSNTAKIGDLGLSSMMGSLNFVNSIKGVGTMAWAAPEVLLGGAPVTCAADVFSFGTVLWEICTGSAPVRGYLRDLKPHEAPPEVASLILQCLAFSPEDRPTMHQAYDVLKDL